MILSIFFRSFRQAMINYCGLAFQYKYYFLKTTIFNLIFFALSSTSFAQLANLTYFNSFQEIHSIDYENGISDLIDQLVKSLNFSDEEVEKSKTLSRASNFSNFSKKDSELSDPQGKLDMQLNFEGQGANIRILDKIYGTVTDLKIYNADSENYGNLGIMVMKCLYSDSPIVNYSGANVRILNIENKELLVGGWLINPHSSLFNINNHRHDVVLLSCIK